jgi:branched-chain amino acid transport system substrate-binding protein
MGGKVLFTSYIQTGDRDFKSQLSEVLSGNPDIIYIPTYYAEGALLAKQARDLGMKVPILMADSAQVPELIETGGEAVEGIYLTGHFAVQTIKSKRGKDFISEYEKRYNKEANAFGALGADAYFILVNAIERAKSTEGPKVSSNLMQTKNYEGISGTMSIGEDGNTVKSLVVTTVKDGKFSYVTTVNP